MATIRCVMPGFSPPHPPSHASRPVIITELIISESANSSANLRIKERKKHRSKTCRSSPSRLPAARVHRRRSAGAARRPSPGHAAAPSGCPDDYKMEKSHRSVPSPRPLHRGGDGGGSVARGRDLEHTRRRQKPPSTATQQCGRTHP
jgi:hypothetical protein